MKKDVNEQSSRRQLASIPANKAQPVRQNVSKISNEVPDCKGKLQTAKLKDPIAIKEPCVQTAERTVLNKQFYVSRIEQIGQNIDSDLLWTIKAVRQNPELKTELLKLLKSFFKRLKQIEPIVLNK
jgi:hypothetical protein